MLTFHWTIDLGTVIQLVLTGIGGLVAVHRLCALVLQLRDRIKAIEERQAEQHLENRTDIREMRAVLMRRSEP